MKQIRYSMQGYFSAQKCIQLSQDADMVAYEKSIIWLYIKQMIKILS